ncbi:SRPBCC family protein [Deinococcus multiflagellatus]|uniref:SRPBCC family protein n=1 Tax=Deinococcus multiflagellatus TaxID=1656887 RepID=UPI001CCC9DCB|nr:SRPBCC family protein [Deinococcus multiflagellatus]MBZ9712584.1 SRPBCC family protein [Deinococcus multiflagellatus]
MTQDDQARTTDAPPADAPSTGAHMPPLERSVVGSVGVALMGAGLRSARPLQKLVLGTVGAGLAAMAATGRNPIATALKIRQSQDGEVLVGDAVTVGRPAAELYAIWRQLENLPQLMTHLQRVEVLDEKRSRWTVKAPTGEVSWDAEITADEPGRRIAWQSLPGAAVENHGEVLFRPAPGNRGTEVVVRLAYRPPAGTAGAIVARLTGEEPAQQLRSDLMRFKREQETGHAPTTEGQTSGRAAKGGEA